MKIKYIVSLLFFIILSLVSPVKVFATSGACSYHEGVNCSIGPTLYGKIQCNDGWVNSSVYFSDTEECKASTPSCYYPIEPYCSLEEIEQEKENALGQNGALNARSGMLDSEFAISTDSIIENEYNLKYSGCQSEWEFFDSQKTQYKKCSDLQSSYYNSYSQKTEPGVENIEENNALFEIIFSRMWDKALQIAPEYKTVANRETIKSLVLLPENRDLTLSQLLKKTYGEIYKEVQKENVTKIVTQPAESKKELLGKEDNVAETQHQPITPDITPIQVEKPVNFKQKILNFLIKFKFW